MKKNFFVLLLLLWTVPLAAAEKESFAEWLHAFKKEAAADGITPALLEESLSGVEYNETVIKLDRNQPEFKLSLPAYLDRTVPGIRVKKGKTKLQENLSLLTEISKRYGVQPRFLIALWGIETDFGRVTGSFPVIEALATLSYDPRRSAFFKRELLASLHVVDDGYIPLKRMEGSWAGAIGYLQFLPSVFRKYGVDYDKDGRITIWEAHCDLFSSGANYLASSGWTPERTWGREVVVPSSLDKKFFGLKNKKKLAEWQKIGVRRLNGRNLPRVNIEASLIQPDRDSDRFFLIYNNFRVLMKWNRSTYYAVAVGVLSDLLVE